MNDACRNISLIVFPLLVATSTSLFGQSIPTQPALDSVSIGKLVEERVNRARTLEFPPDKSLGMLKIRPRRERSLAKNGDDWEWEDYSLATGLVTIPANYEAGLWLSQEGALDLKALDQLDPDDLQWLAIQNIHVRHSEWQHIARLRGLETLIVSSSNLNDADLMYVQPLRHLRWLQISQCADVSDKGLESIGKLSNLNQLVVHMCKKITDAGVAHIAPLHGLRRLGLGYTNVTSAGVALLKDMKRLEDLDLQTTHLTDEGMATLSGFSSLRRLNLEQSRIKNDGLKHLAGLKSLEKIILRSTEVGDEGLANLKDLTGLKELLLSRTKAGDTGMAHLSGLSSLEWLEPPPETTDAGLAHITGMTRLKRLSLQSTKATGAGLVNIKSTAGLELQLPTEVTDEDLENISKIEGLEGLWIQNSPAVTEAGIAHLRGLKSLKDLLLAGLNISCESYAILQEFPALERLGLRPPKNKRNADGTSWLKYVEGLPELEYLNIEATDVADQDLVHLRKLPSLHRLIVRSTRITDAGLANLKDCPSLGWVDAQNTKVTEAGAAQLPNLYIYLPERKATSPTYGADQAESSWQRYVRQFIETYQLKTDQQQTVHSILRQVCNEASAYRQMHETDFARIEQQLANRGKTRGPKTPADSSDLHELKQERRQLEAPIQIEMFNRLKQRLEVIPTADQRSNARSP